jgi:hypothetical protein
MNKEGRKGERRPLDKDWVTRQSGTTRHSVTLGTGSPWHWVIGTQSPHLFLMYNFPSSKKRTVEILK